MTHQLNTFHGLSAITITFQIKKKTKQKQTKNYLRIYKVLKEKTKTDYC